MGIALALCLGVEVIFDRRGFMKTFTKILSVLAVLASVSMVACAPNKHGTKVRKLPAGAQVSRPGFDGGTNGQVITLNGGALTYSISSLNKSSFGGQHDITSVINVNGNAVTLQTRLSAGQLENTAAGFFGNLVATVTVRCATAECSRVYQSIWLSDTSTPSVNSGDTFRGQIATLRDFNTPLWTDASNTPVYQTGISFSNEPVGMSLVVQHLESLAYTGE